MLNNEWLLNSSIPFLDGERKEKGQPDTHIDGLGDISVSMLWNPFSDAEHKLNGLRFLGGFTLPTGNEGNQPLVGVASPEVFQLGTGVFQLTLGASYSKTIADWNYRWDLNLSTPLEKSDQGFQPASVFFTGFTAGRSITDKLSLQLGANLSYGEDDEFQGQEVITAFTKLDLKAGLDYQINDDMNLSTSFSLPVYQDVNETQIGAGTVLNVGLGYSF